MSTREIPQELAEMMAVSALIQFAEKYEERFRTGEVHEEDRCDYRAKLVEDMLWVFYKDNREEIPISKPRKAMTNRELVDFINEEALFYIQEDNPLFLRKDWNGTYEIITDDDLF